MQDKANERLDKLLDQEKKIKAQISQIKAREKEAERKKDTRRKILIGGSVLAKVKRGEWPQQQLIDLINSELKSDRDRVLFDLPLLDK